MFGDIGIVADMDRRANGLTEVLEAMRALRGFSDSVVDGPTIDLLAHSLQTAAILDAEGVEGEVVAAGLLHDIGHGVAPRRQAEHGTTGATFVRPVFGDRVAELIELHIPAKAFLAATDDDYRRRLSAGSRASLDLQGGSLDSDAQEDFLRHKSSSAALTLRRADDRAKDPNAVVPDLLHWKLLLESLSTRRS